VESVNSILNGFKLYDLYGKLIMEENKLVSQKSFEINTEKLSSGTYIIKVSSNKGYTIKRIIISN
jgi:hypothetical protein